MDSNSELDVPTIVFRDKKIALCVFGIVSRQPRNLSDRSRAAFHAKSIAIVCIRQMHPVLSTATTQPIERHAIADLKTLMKPCYATLRTLLA
jgi:hypothetical protein